ncbi:hypothetical protein TWF694_008518 [Orbilia ellipsospora]|uniref:Dehydrin n=1 Tax=Orbilia ellipsospora TaxID=2528407 RepID=A0AAV9XJS0_9PEZI
MSSTEHTASHGRGGAGNIAPDSTEYVDGGIVRTSTPSGNYTTGRGGGGNVGHSDANPEAHDIIPENARHETPPPGQGHAVSTGRGGGGNIVLSENEKEQQHQGLADKIKEKLFHHTK